MLSRTRSEDCLSDLRLDELRAGELSGVERAAALAHLGSCAACPERLAVLDETRVALGAKLPPLGTERPPLVADDTPLPARRSSRWRLAVLGTAVACAALVVFFVVPRRSPSPTRTKGSDELTFYVTGSGGTRFGGAGEIVHPGDTLSFSVAAPKPTYVAILSRDGAGRASVYHPFAAASLGKPSLLPVATILDGTLGTEHIYAVFCDARIELEPLRLALAARAELPPLPRGCRAESLTLEKTE